MTLSPGSHLGPYEVLSLVRSRARAPLRLRALLLALFVAIAASASRSAAGPDIQPRKGWIRLQAPNFLLLGDVSARDLRQVAERLEQFREALGVALPNAILTTPAPTTVLVFETHKSYEPLKPRYQGKTRDLAGFFQAGEAVNYVTLTLEGGLDNLGTIYHEYVHLLVNNNVGDLPLWLNEGLAEYYGTFQVSDSGDYAILGRIQKDHVLLLRQQFIPLQTIVAVDQQSPLYNETDKASIFYAESWALVHYLILGEEQKFAKQMGAFAMALSKGQSLDDAAWSALGISAAELESGLRRHIGRDVFQSQNLAYSERIAKLSAIQPTPVSEADVHATLGDLLLQMDRRDEAKAELAAALALDDSHGPAHASLGILDLREGKWDASRAHFERAVASSAANFLCHYYYGVALSRTTLASGAPGADDLAAMERSFRRAIELNPSFADAYAQLASVVGRTSERTQAAVDLMLEALQLAPGREDYLLGLGMLLSNRPDLTEAKQVLTALAARGSDTTVRNQARTRLDQIVEFEKQRTELEASTRTTIDRPHGPSTTVHLPTAGSPTLLLKLRDPKPGETRYSGQLTNIECGPHGIVLVIKVDAETVRARAAKFDAVEFITYREDAGRRVKCGPRKLADNVVLTLRLDGGTRTQGVAVAVEVVPEDYHPY